MSEPLIYNQLSIMWKHSSYQHYADKLDTHKIGNTEGLLMDCNYDSFLLPPKEDPLSGLQTAQGKGKDSGR